MNLQRPRVGCRPASALPGDNETKQLIGAPLAIPCIPGISLMTGPFSANVNCAPRRDFDKGLRCRCVRRRFVRLLFGGRTANQQSEGGTPSAAYQTFRAMSGTTQRVAGSDG